MNKTSHKGKGKLKFNCKFCGHKHEKQRDKCPAWARHLTTAKVLTTSSLNAKIFMHSTSPMIMGKILMINGSCMAVNNGTDSVTATLTLNDIDVKFQLDPAADVNTICQKHVRQHQVSPTIVRLNMWNKTNLKPLGETRLKVENPRTSSESDKKFIVVPNGFTNLLGLNTTQELGFITINKECVISQVSTPQLGDLGEATHRIDESVPPKVLPSRKVPIAIQDAVKEELDQLVNKGVLVPVTEPTEWVSQMAVVHKPNGKLRICIDPQPLNAALKREHYRLSVLDDVFPKHKNAKIFSKLDVKEAYWHVRLDEASSKPTTMITAFGRYMWKRLSFGLKVSSEIFQCKIDKPLGDLDGVFNIVNGVIIVVCGNSDAEAQSDNQ